MTQAQSDEIGAPLPEAAVSGVLMSGAAIAGSAGSVLGAALSLINDVLAAHILGAEAYGSYGLALMLAKVGEIIALFGVPLAVLHFLPVHLSQSQYRLALGVVVGSIVLPLAAGVSFALGRGSGMTGSLPTSSSSRNPPATSPCSPAPYL